MVLGASALFALMVAAASRSDGPQPVVEPQFNEKWNGGGSSVMFKTVMVTTEPKPVKTEMVTVIPPIIPVEEVERKPRRSKQDVCSRHGMRKVYRGRGWRCRR